MRLPLFLPLVALSFSRSVAQPVHNVSPSFEAASIRPARGGPIRIDSDPARLAIRNESVDVLIRLAFGLREYEYEGPAWLHTARYDIVAIMPSPASRAEQLAMLRNLLASRFNLATQRETKVIAIYALVVGTRGSKLKPMDAHLPAPFELYSNFSLVPAAGGVTELRGYGSVGQLTDFLSRLAGRPVVDRTGITGNFDISLVCAVDGYPGFETSPTVFDAVQSQLGLKLEARKSPIEVTIVDRIEKPGEN